MHHIAATLVSHSNVRDNGIPANSPASQLSVAASDVPVVQERTHFGHPAPSSCGADSVSLVRNDSARGSAHLATVHAVSRMSSSPAVNWQENHRASAALVSRIAHGDDQALAQLYDNTSRLVYGLCLRIVRDPAAAEDITLETFLQLWRTAASYDPVRGTVLAWLLTVVRSRSIDWLRARKSRRADLEETLDGVFDLQDTRPSPESASIDAGRARLIRDAMAGLPAEQRRAIELTYFSGLSHSEIASHTGLPVGTVKTRIRLGMMRLRELLGPYAEGL